ncbi:50S ribosomal protein L28 [Lentzea sp. NBC_00516]|nr:50S ribosomal protein L28 [Lentzea sp. NBC_00516]WUD22133.1 50S ribosomal protein L28 [Lentzea sp. NBC_00516]
MKTKVVSICVHHSGGTSVRCQLTGREPGFGNRVSHSQRKTRRRWNPNIQQKRYWVPSLNRNVSLTLSAKGIKTVDKLGIEATVARLRTQGVKV